MVESAEMETDRTFSLWPRKVLIIPPVCISQSLMVLSSLPDARNTPSDEKVTDLTLSVWPERTPAWLPVTAFKITMSQEVRPTAMVSFQYEMASGLEFKETVREHAPHPAGSPLMILTSFIKSEL
jgi:hypothetical protein